MVAIGVNIETIIKIAPISIKILGFIIGFIA